MPKANIRKKPVVWGPAGQRLIAKQRKTEAGRQQQELTRVMLDAVLPLAELMEEQGVTHRELAERLGMSRQRVGKILSGDSNLTLETLAKAYYVLGHRLMIECATPGAIGE